MSDKGHIDTGNALDRTENLANKGGDGDPSTLSASSAETTVRKARKATTSIPPRSSKSAPPRISVAPMEPKGRPSRSIPATKVPRTRRSIPPTTSINEPAADLASPISLEATDSPRLDAGVREALPAASPANVIVSEATQAEDQVSIPPATSDVAENGAQTFTSTSPAISDPARSDATAHANVMALRPAGTTAPEVDATDAYEAQLANRISRERRAKSQKYVKAIVGIAAVLCLAAIARVGIARMGRPPEPVAHAAVTEPAVAAAPAPVEEPVAAEPEPAALPATPVGDKTAGEEKKAALGALEKRKLDDAIAAGERSVALDPSDGDAWRILGAAYQDSGRIADAHRCYSECTKHGKKGEIRECSFLLSK